MEPLSKNGTLGRSVAGPASLRIYKKQHNGPSIRRCSGCSSVLPEASAELVELLADVVGFQHADRSVECHPGHLDDQ